MKRRGIFEMVLYVVAAGAVVALSYSNWRLRGIVEMQSQVLRAKAPAPPTMAAGEPFMPLEATDRSGRLVRVGAGAAESTLIVVDPACASCAAVIDELRKSGRRDVSVLALYAPGKKQSPPAGLPADVPLYALSREHNPALIRRLGGVPRVIRIAADGRIRAVCKTLGECAAA